jgi:hypothetical protein
MEITFQNNQEDFEAYYDYMVKETDQGKNINKRQLIAQQAAIFLSAIVVGSLISVFSESLPVTITLILIYIIILEVSFLSRAGFKPRYYYGKQVYREQERLYTPKHIQIFSLPRKIYADDDWLEISNSEASHRYRWRVVDHIGLTPEHIFIHVGVCPVVYVPKRNFTSEQSFIDFGKTLVELQEKNKDQPIGGE